MAHTWDKRQAASFVPTRCIHASVSLSVATVQLVLRVSHDIHVKYQNKDANPDFFLMWKWFEVQYVKFNTYIDKIDLTVGGALVVPNRPDDVNLARHVKLKGLIPVSRNLGRKSLNGVCSVAGSAFHT